MRKGAGRAASQRRSETGQATRASPGAIRRIHELALPRLRAVLVRMDAAFRLTHAPTGDLAYYGYGQPQLRQDCREIFAFLHGMEGGDHIEFSGIATPGERSVDVVLAMRENGARDLLLVDASVQAASLRVSVQMAHDAELVNYALRRLLADREPGPGDASQKGGTRLVLGSDKPVFRIALRLILARLAPNATIVEADSLGALSALIGDGVGAGLALIDPDLPGGPGTTGLLQLGRRYPALPIALLGSVQDPAVVRRALALGAVGYIPHSLPPESLERALSAVLAGERWVPPGFEHAQDGVPEDALARRIGQLSPAQMNVLLRLAGGPLNKQLAAQMGVSEATIKSHVSGLLHKLGFSRRTEAVALALRLQQSGSPG